jgi:hypothetical protein
MTVPPARVIDCSLLYGVRINPLDPMLSRRANDLRFAIHGEPEQMTIQN